MARQALRLARQVVKDVDLEKQSVTEEIEVVRPKVEDAPADSGLVEAYREAIAVSPPAQTGINWAGRTREETKAFSTNSWSPSYTERGGRNIQTALGSFKAEETSS